MQLKELYIDNFSCFRHYHVSFAPNATVVVGRNGTGKTSLIRAMVYALNFLFTNDKSMGEKYLSAGNPDLKMSSLRAEEFYRVAEAAEVVDYANFRGLMEWRGRILEWNMYKKSLPGSSLNPSRYIDAYRSFMAIAEESNILPVLAFYSDSFPHTHTNISTFAKNEINNTDGILRNFGYYQWDKETACTKIWQLRLVNVLAKDLSLADPKSSVHREATYIQDCLKRFSQSLNEEADDSYVIEKVFFSFRNGEKPELWLKLKSQQEIRFDSLPAGYLRLYSIVLDLAYRSYLLNRKSGRIDAVGIVMIDEVDLHLHPSLEMEVVDRFTRTFPGIQFVMTTHSPLVVTNISLANNKNKILRLVAGEDSPHELPDVYGVDYNAGLEIMDVNVSDRDIEFIKDMLVRCHRRGDETLFEKKKEELRQIVSPQRFEQILHEILMSP